LQCRRLADVQAPRRSLELEAFAVKEAEVVGEFFADFVGPIAGFPLDDRLKIVRVSELTTDVDELVDVVGDVQYRGQRGNAGDQGGGDNAEQAWSNILHA
jgi:hypothetical protein